MGERGFKTLSLWIAVVTTVEEKLLALAVEGDEEALTGLLARHGLPIRQGLKITSKWRSLIEPDDVMQVTYLEAFLRIRQFTPTSANGFANWLRRIAENNLLDAVKALECDKRGPSRVHRPTTDSHAALLEQIGGTTTTPSRTAGRREVQKFVEDALGELPPVYAKVLRLCELEGRSSAEAAAELGRSDGAVRMLLCRAKDRLREVLGSGAAYFSDTA